MVWPKVIPLSAAYILYLFLSFFSEDILFSNLYENQLSKNVAIAFSIISVILTTPLLGSVISYEAQNNYRILIGRLLSSNVSSMIVWNFTAQVRDVRFNLKPYVSLTIFTFSSPAIRTEKSVKAAFLSESSDLYKFEKQFGEQFRASPQKNPLPSHKLAKLL
jgi:hypothetical protein